MCSGNALMRFLRLRTKVGYENIAAIRRDSLQETNSKPLWRLLVPDSFTSPQGRDSP